MRVRIKTCGITSAEAAEAASQAGVDAIGFVFAESPRRISIDRALEVSEYLPPFVTRVAVFRHPDPSAVAEVIKHLRPDVIQTEPTPELQALIAGRSLLLPVIHDGSDLLERVAAYRDHSFGKPHILLEAAGRGGRGLAPDWESAKVVARDTRLILAGGLRPDNVAEAIRMVSPYGVDVSSGVERDIGVKDPQLIVDFVSAVRIAETDLEAKRLAI